MAPRFREWSIASRLFLVQLIAIAIVAIIALVVLSNDARLRVEEDAAARSLAVATSIADNPFVLESLQTGRPTDALQPFAMTLMRDTGLDFITIMSPDRTRLTHPDPTQIGKAFRGTIKPALAGESFTETFPGTLGPSVRAVVPIRSAEGEIVALAAAGITVDNVTVALNARLPFVIGIAALLAFGIALASFALSRYLRKATWGRGPEQMRHMFSFYESVLHSVREGLVLVDRDGLIVLYNDQAAEMLGLSKERTDSPTVAVDSLDLPESLRRLLASGETAIDEIHLTDSQVLVVNQEPALPSGRFAPRVAVGTVTSLRDHTEVTRLASELQSTTTLSDALRSQTHEHANRLHTIISLIELGRASEARSLATNELGTGQELADQVMGALREPVLAALLLGKSAQARESGVALHIDCPDDIEIGSLPPHDLVTILGNLVDNAIESVLATGLPDPWVEVYLARERDGSDVRLTIQVSDNGPGLDPAQLDRATERGFSTKDPGQFGRGIGLALVLQAVRRSGGSISSRTDDGSAIVVELPVVGASSATAGGRR